MISRKQSKRKGHSIAFKLILAFCKMHMYFIIMHYEYKTLYTRQESRYGTKHSTDFSMYYATLVAKLENGDIRLPQTRFTDNF